MPKPPKASSIFKTAMANKKKNILPGSEQLCHSKYLKKNSPEAAKWFVKPLGIDIRALHVANVSLETPTNINSLNDLAANPASGSLLGLSGSSSE